MALIDKNREPTPGELRIFGALLAVFFGLIGGLVMHRTGSWTFATVLWTAALLLCAFYYAVPIAQPMVFQAWLAMVYPIGWIISHALLAVIFYLVITPIGLVVRLCDRDPLQRQLARSAKTYWTPHNTTRDVRHYFQQF
jgi:hypothetical protein